MLSILVWCSDSEFWVRVLQQTCGCRLKTKHNLFRYQRIRYAYTHTNDQWNL